MAQSFRPVIEAARLGWALASKSVFRLLPGRTRVSIPQILPPPPGRGAGKINLRAAPIYQMTAKTSLALTLALALLTAAIRPGPAAAAEAAVSAKQFPSGYFYRFRQVPLAEKEKVLALLAATLERLNREGLGLIAKGALLEPVDTLQPSYARLPILDESGLIIIARRVPNLYYGYRGPGPLNPNTYLVIRQVRVNLPESYMRYGYVVEGDFVGYAGKFVTAIMEGLEGTAAGKEEGIKK